MKAWTRRARPPGRRTRCRFSDRASGSGTCSITSLSNTLSKLSVERELLRVLDAEVATPGERPEVALSLGQRAGGKLRCRDDGAGLDERTRVRAAAAADLEDLLAGPCVEAPRTASNRAP